MFLNNYNFQEEINTPETEIIEENIFIDENSMRNKDLIRMEMNIIQYPIFSKNTKRKINQIIKYYFNSNRDTYVSVIPASGDYIPGETEEKVFIALMKLMKDKKMDRKFTVTMTELKKELNMNTTRYGNIIKNSLLRLAKTNYNFKNTMYSAEINGVLKREISTPILTLDIISLEENKKMRGLINDARVKEVYQIEISDYFYKNILKKGYLVYSSKVLLNIEFSTARTIYMLIEKLRYNNLYLKIDSLFLIKRIPLKLDKRNLSQTISILKNNFQHLKDKKLIKDFKIIKDTTWINSEIEIFFENFSVEEKQSRFFQDRNDIKKILNESLITDTTLEENNLNYTQEITEDIINNIYKNLPLKARTIKSLEKTIIDMIKKYGYEKVLLTAKYIKNKKVDKIKAYFIKALENDWAHEGDKESKNIFMIEKKNKDELDNLDKNIFQKFQLLESNIKKEIEVHVYKEYIKECGIETSIQKKAYKYSREILISKFLNKNPEIIANIKNKSNETEEKIVDDILKLKDYVEEYIKNLKIFFNKEDINEEEIREIIIIKLMRNFMKKQLSLKQIDKIILEVFNNSKAK